MKQIFQDTAGAMLVEMAIVFPLVLLLTMGTVELALWNSEANSAYKATQLGARWAVVNPPISTTLQTDLASTAWWDVGTLGESCETTEKGCKPSTSDTYICKSGLNACDLSTLGNPILTQMQKAYPGLKAEHVTVRYEAYNPSTEYALGFVGRPGGPPMKVIVEICKPFEFTFLSAFVPTFSKPAAIGECAGKADGWYTRSTARLVSESFGEPSASL